MSYAFYGWETATIPPAQPDNFPSIRSPQELYDALRTVWCAETCAPRMRKDWSPENPTLGQCSITAFLVQDIFGGRVYGIPLGDGNYHLYNVAAGRCFDLTSEQFGEKARNRPPAGEESRAFFHAPAGSVQKCNENTGKRRGRVFFCSSLKYLYFPQVLKICCKNARSGEGNSAGDFGLKN